MKLTLNSLTKIISILVILLGVANLISTNVLATGGRELESIYQETINLEKDNRYLSNKIAQATSIANLEEKANVLGFVQITKTLAIATPAPVAYVAQ
jgi:hypothetical protein